LGSPYHSARSRDWIKMKESGGTGGEAGGGRGLELRVTFG
jgi:ATP-dependent DNA ligase